MTRHSSITNCQLECSRLQHADASTATASSLECLQGNELFRNEDFEGALNRLKLALDYIDQDLLFQLQGRYLDDAHAVKAPLHLNAAACHLKLEDWASAAEEATECIKLIGPGTEALASKALFRRAKAYIGTGRTEDAIKDLQKAKQLYVPSRPHADSCGHTGMASDTCMLQQRVFVPGRGMLCNPSVVVCVPGEMEQSGPLPPSIDV
jgi:tetratricopeptide (TPR) repeat protein